MEEQNVKKLSVCVLFGGVSPEHEVSLRSAESVLNNLDKEKYNIFPVGITKTGEWIKIPLFGSIESLNVSVAAGILIYEAVKQRGFTNEE